MNRNKVTIRFCAGPYGGWTMDCPVCPAVIVRDTWPIVMRQATKHIGIHQRGPFAIRNAA